MDIEAKDHKGRTPLQRALQYKNIDAVKSLLEYDAIRDNGGAIIAEIIAFGNEKPRFMPSFKTAGLSKELLEKLNTEQEPAPAKSVENPTSSRRESTARGHRP